jgi:peptidoglycan hydrolase-like protein with peptidoglycan-binding domain
MLKNSLILSFCVLAISACGHTKIDRSVSGAGIGAATGAAVGAVTGLSVAQGALLGAAGGAIVGLATESDQVNLGKPAWKQGSSDSASRSDNYVAASGSADRSTVRSIQTELQRHGFNPGPADGVVGPRTREAIRDYQLANGLLVDGRATYELDQHIRSH